MRALSDLPEITQLLRFALYVRDSETLSWEEKYNIIFSDSVSIRLSDLNVEVDYYDPDSSEQEDVNAYVNALVPIYSK